MRNPLHPKWGWPKGKRRKTRPVGKPLGWRKYRRARRLTTNVRILRVAS